MTKQPESENVSSDVPLAVRTRCPIVSNGPDLLEKPGRAGRQRCRASTLLRLEFPDPSIEVLDEPSRRDFLRFMAASLALGGESAAAPISRTSRSCRTSRRPKRSSRASRCSSPRRFPSTAMRCGVLVKSHMGRPINLEGNPAHPASLGAVDIFGQATILTLYDPDRSQLVTHNARVDTWEHLQTVAPRQPRQSCSPTKGAGLRILTQTVASPTLADQLRRLQRTVSRGEMAQLRTADSRCRVGGLPAGVRRRSRAGLPPRSGRRDRCRSTRTSWRVGRRRLNDARGFAGAARGRRRAAGATDEPAVCRRADLDAHRCRRRSPAGRRGARCRPVCPGDRRRAEGGSRDVDRGQALPHELAGHAAWIGALARDLAAHRGKSVVIAGETQPAEVHALRPPDQSRAGQRRQDGRVHRACRCRACRPDRLAPRAGARHERRRGRHADHPRWQPGLRCSRRTSNSPGCWPATRSSFAFTSGCTKTRRPSSATGTSPRPTASNRGATFRLLTGRRRSSSP